ncbi:MAG: YnbE family lipoprotein [Neptuniibacter sp.]
MKPNYLLQTSVLLLALASVSGCSPRVEVAVPSEPITINLNVKIEHEILVKVDKEIDELLSENSDIF